MERWSFSTSLLQTGSKTPKLKNGSKSLKVGRSVDLPNVKSVPKEKILLYVYIYFIGLSSLGVIFFPSLLSADRSVSLGY